MPTPSPVTLRSPVPSAVRVGASSRRRAVVATLLVWCAVAGGVLLGAAPAAAGPTAGRWQWPVDPPHEVVGVFEQPEHRYAAGHRGIDIAVPVGAEVRAVEDGTVRFAGDVAGRGVVSVLHADGLLSTYEPVVPVVTAGDEVRTGTLLGHLGTAAGGGDHCVAAACLHLGARTGEDYLDPVPLLGARGPSVLLPLTGEDARAAPGGERRGMRPAPTPVGATGVGAVDGTGVGGPLTGGHRLLRSPSAH